MRRRDLLLGGAAAATVGLFAPRRARAAWAEAHGSAAKDLLPPGVRAESVLEVFMYGGMSPWESFYVADEYGRPDDPTHPNTQWHLFAEQHAATFGDCGMPDPAGWLQDWVVDANGVPVRLGPHTLPLRQRPDVLARMRVVVCAHDLEPHEAAIPYALSGHRLGNPRMTGMGAHVQRYFQERDATGRVSPFSYVLTNDRILSTDNLIASTSVGLHPGSARPLSLTISEDSDLDALLARGHLTAAQRGDVDAMLAHYARRMERRYSTPGGAPLRSRSIGDHSYAVAAMAQAPALAQILGQGLLAGEPNQSCDVREALDTTRVGIRAAAELLRHPTDPARYVNIIDTGLRLADGGGGYDTHFEHPRTQASNTMSLLQNLMDHINAPGENDPTKISLDETMVVLTTEFGRTPFIQDAMGTNHHPYGYVCVLLGGPIREANAGLVGAIGPDGTATHSVTPDELRAACLAAMGMYPFSHESFAVGDIRGVGSEHQGMLWCQEHVLGVTA